MFQKLCTTLPANQIGACFSKGAIVSDNTEYTGEEGLTNQVLHQENEAWAQDNQEEQFVSLVILEIIPCKMAHAYVDKNNSF